MDFIRLLGVIAMLDGLGRMIAWENIMGGDTCPWFFLRLIVSFLSTELALDL